jgi:hypothetical protein
MTHTPKPPALGVCYYPEHWPESTWAEDAARMRAIGLSWVRVGEFAWSELEPEPGRYDWGWLDRAIDGLGAAGLRVVLGTPSATPPKWLVDRMPDMLPVGRDGRVRGFGSRRHYDFSHEGYRDEAARMAAAMAERYGRHEAVGAWQIDNEYGCHDTARTAGPVALAAFRRWLADRYGTVDALNEAWWTRFWSMRYRSFDEVELPVGAVTEAAPGARLDYARFASEAVVAFHRRQADEIRPRSPGRPITHNDMGFFTDLDAHALGRHLDAITWDSYPLGMLEESPLPHEVKARYARTGHPDLIAFNHDVYRGALAPEAGAPYRPFWVMEQQPGQVNWAPTNPLPAPGAVRLWTHQAIAHGAEVVSYFRWRAAQGAQEHMHAGLLRHDRTPDRALLEAEAAAHDLAGPAGPAGSPPRPRGAAAELRGPVGRPDPTARRGLARVARVGRGLRRAARPRPRRRHPAERPRPLALRPRGGALGDDRRRRPRRLAAARPRRRRARRARPPQRRLPPRHGRARPGARPAGRAERHPRRPRRHDAARHDRHPLGPRADARRPRAGRLPHLGRPAGTRGRHRGVGDLRRTRLRRRGRHHDETPGRGRGRHQRRLARRPHLGAAARHAGPAGGASGAAAARRRPPEPPRRPPAAAELRQRDGARRPAAHRRAARRGASVDVAWVDLPESADGTADRG